MRDRLWLTLRKSRLLRKLYALRVFAGPMRFASYLLVPSSSRKCLRVQAGLAKGLLLELDPRWEHSAWDGSYEPQAVEAFMGLVRHDTLVFDIGANFGFYALLAGRAGANVIAFEPDPENASSLMRHVDVNGLAERIHIVRQAVFSHVGNLTLTASEGLSAHRNTKVGANHTDNSAGIGVLCTTLDDFIGTNAAPTLVKIDVEGAESDVLRGADRLFRSYRPHLLCEVHDDSNAAFVEGWLKERGYACSWIEEEALYPRHLLARASP